MSLSLPPAEPDFTSPAAELPGLDDDAPDAPDTPDAADPDTDPCSDDERPGRAGPLPAHLLLHRIQAGLLAPDQLTQAQRRACVHHLSQDGFSNLDIAQLLDIHERTVQRDRRAHRKSEALRPDCFLGDELMGEYQSLAQGSIQRPIRLSQDQIASATSRLRIEETIYRIFHRFLQTMRELDYFERGSARLQFQRDLDNRFLDRFKVRLAAQKERQELNLRLHGLAMPTFAQALEAFLAQRAEKAGEQAAESTGTTGADDGHARESNALVDSTART